MFSHSNESHISNIDLIVVALLVSKLYKSNTLKLWHIPNIDAKSVTFYVVIPLNFISFSLLHPQNMLFRDSHFVSLKFISSMLKHF